MHSPRTWIAKRGLPAGQAGASVLAALVLVAILGAVLIGLQYFRSSGNFAYESESLVAATAGATPSPTPSPSPAPALVGCTGPRILNESDNTIRDVKIVGGFLPVDLKTDKCPCDQTQLKNSSNSAVGTTVTEQCLPGCIYQIKVDRSGIPQIIATTAYSTPGAPKGTVESFLNGTNVNASCEAGGSINASKPAASGSPMSLSLTSASGLPISTIAGVPQIPSLSQPADQGSGALSGALSGGCTNGGDPGSGCNPTAPVAPTASPNPAVTPSGGCTNGGDPGSGCNPTAPVAGGPASQEQTSPPPPASTAPGASPGPAVTDPKYDSNVGMYYCSTGYYLFNNQCIAQGSDFFPGPASQDLTTLPPCGLNPGSPCDSTLHPSTNVNTSAPCEGACNGGGPGDTFNPNPTVGPCANGGDSGSGCANPGPGASPSPGPEAPAAPEAPGAKSPSLLSKLGSAGLSFLTGLARGYSRSQAQQAAIAQQQAYQQAYQQAAAPYGVGNNGLSCPPPQPQPSPSSCTVGMWRQLYQTNQCPSTWQCVPNNSNNPNQNPNAVGQQLTQAIQPTSPTATNPTASLSCQPQTADVGMSISLSYSCGNATGSSGSGFDTQHQLSGSATALISTPPAGTNTASYTLTCINQFLTASAQCAVEIDQPTIVLVANPSAVASGATSAIGWVTSGMSACTISSPDSAAFTTANAGDTSVNGVATTPPLTAPMTFVLNCRTISGGTRSATTQVDVAAAAS